MNKLGFQSNHSYKAFLKTSTFDCKILRTSSVNIEK